MKVFIFLAIVALACADGEWKPKTPAEMKTIRTDCLASHPLSEEALAKIRNWEYPDEEPVRQLLLCTALKLEIFTTENGYNADRLSQQFNYGLDQAEALAITQNCIGDNDAGSPADVRVYRVHKCMVASKIGDQLRTFIKNKLQAAKKD